MKLIFAIFLTSVSIYAEFIGTYYARLANVDHYNSRGVRLHNVASIIRQDRYNFHIRGIKQIDDTGDPFFYIKSNRDLLERMLSRGIISRYAKNRILYGTPLIKVDIYSDHLNVKIIDERPRTIIH